MIADTTFELMGIKQASEIAMLHAQGIDTGFIRSLGANFLTSLYEAISQSKDSFGLVARQDENIVGFVAFTKDLKSLYKTAIKCYGVSFFFAIGIKLLSPKVIRRIFQNLFYPYQS